MEFYAQLPVRARSARQRRTPLDVGAKNEADIFGAMYLAHSADADERLRLVRAKPRSRRERGTRRVNGGAPACTAAPSLYAPLAGLRNASISADRARASVSPSSMSRPM